MTLVRTVVFILLLVLFQTNAMHRRALMQPALLRTAITGNSALKIYPHSRTISTQRNIFSQKKYAQSLPYLIAGTLYYTTQCPVKNTIYAEETHKKNKDWFECDCSQFPTGSFFKESDLVEHYLQSKVKEIYSSEKSIMEKIDELHLFFKDAICSNAVEDPYKPILDNGNGKQLALSIRWRSFASIMGFALAESRLDLLECMFKKGVSPDGIIALDNLSGHRIMPAIAFAELKALPIFKKYGANFNAPIPYYNNGGLLHMHIHAPDTQMVEWLLQNTDIDVNQQDNDGLTALHHLIEWSGGWGASTERDSKIFTMLLQQNTINPYVKDNQGRTVADLAEERARSLESDAAYETEKFLNIKHQLEDSGYVGGTVEGWVYYKKKDGTLFCTNIPGMGWGSDDLVIANPADNKIKAAEFCRTVAKKIRALEKEFQKK